jgi:hypothetical protein
LSLTIRLLSGLIALLLKAMIVIAAILPATRGTTAPAVTLPN